MHARFVPSGTLLCALAVSALVAGCDAPRTRGVEFRYRLQSSAAPDENEKLSASQVAQRRTQVLTRTDEVVTVIRKRLHGIDVQIKTDGTGEVVIRLFDATPGTRLLVRRRVEQMGRLEFREVLSEDACGKMTEEERKAVRVMRMKLRKKRPEDPDAFREHYVRVRDEYDITGRLLERVQPAVDEFGMPAVGFTFTREGGELFGEMTGKLAGKGQIAVILNGQLRSAPAVQERIGRRVIIRGRFSEAEVKDLVAVLQAGALPEPLVLESEKRFGPEDKE